MFGGASLLAELALKKDSWSSISDMQVFLSETFSVARSACCESLLCFVHTLTTIKLHFCRFQLISKPGRLSFTGLVKIG